MKTFKQIMEAAQIQEEVALLEEMQAIDEARKEIPHHEIDAALSHADPEHTLKVMNGNHNATKEHLDAAMAHGDHRVRAAAAAHPNATKEHLDLALSDGARYVRARAWKNPNAPDHIKSMTSCPAPQARDGKIAKGLNTTHRNPSDYKLKDTQPKTNTTPSPETKQSDIDHEAEAKKYSELAAHHAALAKKTAIEAKVNKTTTDIDNSKEGEEAEVTAKKSAEVATSTEKAPVKDTSSPTTPPKRKSIARLSDFAKGVAKRDDADKPHDSTSGSFDKSKTASFKQVDIPPEAKKVHKSKEVEADKVNDREEKSGAGRAEGDVGSETKKQNFGTDADISAAPDWLTGVKNTIVSKAKGRVVRGSAQSNKPGKTSDKFKKIDSEIK
jgi:hypothetical protein